ncbi:DUF1223 domain-containing protein [Jeongeupia wiesaeckerbachi]|uniref:DUF1223 domain-containing protein n=1 Tax=Jeongeupia wiesaeckerbachi TaxID=3051218 RepID=UPI003D805F87
MHRFCYLGLAAACGTSPAVAATCNADSGMQRAALVELYTSEGCSSCPPADARLNTLGGDPRVIPLALHVGYWDGLGWHDRFARDGHAGRQRALVSATGGATVYTPHFFINGKPLLEWRERLDALIAQPLRQTASLRLQLLATVAGPGRVRFSVTVSPPPADSGALQLLVGLSEDGLTSKIAAGENRGALLKHDHVVRVLSAPLAIPAGGGTLTQTLTLPDDAGTRLRAVAFVQRAGTLDVVQAVQSPSCTLR